MQCDLVCVNTKMREELQKRNWQGEGVQDRRRRILPLIALMTLIEPIDFLRSVVSAGFSVDEFSAMVLPSAA
jgi:hypothetical protein